MVAQHFRVRDVESSPQSECESESEEKKQRSYVTKGRKEYNVYFYLMFQ